MNECSAHTSLSPVYGYSPRRQWLVPEASRNRVRNTTLPASLTTEGIGECLAVEGATTKVVFEAYVARVLAPSSRAGQALVMDNLAAHKGASDRELIEEQGCELLFLQPYSPDLDPIEKAFVKVKTVLRRAAPARRSSSLWERPSRRSHLGTPWASSGIAATVGRFSFSETRCRPKFCKETRATSCRDPTRRGNPKNLRPA